MRISWIIVILFLLIASSSISAASTPRVKDDSRLQEKIILDVRCEPLSLFCRILENSTGAKIRVKRDIQDQNITFFSKEIAPHEAMRQVALLYGYYWEVGGEPGRYSYTLYRPLKRIKEAEELRTSDSYAKEAEFRIFIEDAIELANSDNAAFQKAFEKDPQYASHIFMFRDTLKAFGSFSSTQRNNIWDRIAESPDGEILIPFRELPRSLQDYFRKTADEAHAKYADSPDSTGIEDQSLIISRGGGYGSPRISGMPIQSRISYFGITGMGGSAGLGNVLSTNSSSVSDYAIKMIQDAGIDVSSYKKPEVDQNKDYVSSESERVSIKFEDEKKNIEYKKYTFADVLKAASETHNIDIIADDYLSRRLNNRSFRTTFPKDLDETVAEIGEDYGYYAVINDGILRLRNKTWYEDELYEVPKRLVETWSAWKKEKGELDFFDLVEIAGTLTNPQLQGLMQVEEKESIRRPFSGYVMRMASHVDRMRLCSMFTSSQMAIAFDTGLSMRTMTYDQQEFFAYLLRSERPDLSDDELWECTFHIGNEESRREISEEEAKMNEMEGGPFVHVTYSIAFTYIYGSGEEQKFNFMQRFENIVKE
ncbi:MAG: hypothetical protein ACYC27_09240 [Armatimonadota bacterium]